MPKIQLAKFDKVVVPADEVYYLNGYRFDHRAPIFQTRPKYLEYLKTRRADNLFRINVNNTIAELSQSQTWDQVIDWFNNNGPFMYRLLRHSDGWRGNDTRWSNINPEDFKVELSYLKIEFGKASNTHAAPRGGVTNWGCDPTKPIGYPGWKGRIEFTVSHDFPGFISDAAKRLGIHTGTGGSGRSLVHGYDVNLFDSDWPGISAAHTFELIKDPKFRATYEHGEPKYFTRW
jgi:hypothetical protein